MFGIVRPCTHRLSEGLRVEWMAHRCGLCLALRAGHGQFARIVTNCDGLIVAGLTEAQTGLTPADRRTAGPCPLRAMRTAPVAKGEGARLAAAVSLVLASAKVRDHVADRDGLLARRPVAAAMRSWSCTGRRGIERYGMTETLMNTGIRADGAPRPGTVGPPLAGVELRLAEEDGTVLGEPGAIGEIQVRGPNLFTGYLNRPDATAAAHTADGWFRTGDVGTVDEDGYVAIVGRKATDLIKSGGYKIGAGEIENVLLAHPGVREAAVTGEEDPDLGERVVAWVVAADPGSPPAAEELADHVAAQLAPHKRPRTVRYLDALPRNDLGKIMKRSLGAG